MALAQRFDGINPFNAISVTLSAQDVRTVPERLLQALFPVRCPRVMPSALRDVGVVSPAWVKHLKVHLEGWPRPLKVLSPCAGLNAPARAALELGAPWLSVGDWDVTAAVAPALQKLCVDDSCLHVGASRGDVTRVDLADLDLETDAVISGPPCPPFSTMGARLIEMDSRSNVFISVALWILHLARRGRLAFWCVENVAGILRKRSGSGMSFGEWFVAEMDLNLPQGWLVQVHNHNSIDCLLPQSRPRVFFVGVAPSLQVSRFQKRLLWQPLLSWPRVRLTDFIDMEASPEDWAALTIRQQLNVESQLAEFASLLKKSPRAEVSVALIDSSRDPHGKVDAGICIEASRTLRTNNLGLWLLPSEDLKDKIGPKGRKLSRLEKCRLAGISAESLEGMTDTEVEVAIGNTIPVSLIGVVLYPLFRCALQALRSPPCT